MAEAGDATDGEQKEAEACAPVVDRLSPILTQPLAQREEDDSVMDGKRVEADVLATRDVRVIDCIASCLVYFFQSSSYAIFETLFPVLYASAGFPEDDLSALRFAGIPWCCVGLFGWFMQSVWRPPRWFVMVCQVLMGLIVASLYFVPLESVKVTVGIYFVGSVITTAQDAAVDGMMVRIFAGNSFMLQATESFGIAVMYLILSFVTITVFNRGMFLGWGLAASVSSLLFLVFEWESPPLVKARGVFAALLKQWHIGLYALVYYFITYWGPAMMGYFAWDITESDRQVGIIYGVYYIGVLVGYSIGRYLILKIPFHIGCAAAYLFEVGGTLFLMFLKLGHSFSLKLGLFFCAGILCVLSDGITETLVFDASALSGAPMFIVNIHKSFLWIGMLVGGVVLPQIKERLTWNQYWVANIGSCSAAAVLLIALSLFVRRWREDPVLSRLPSLDMDLPGAKFCGPKAEIDEAAGHAGEGE